MTPYGGLCVCPLLRLPAHRLGIKKAPVRGAEGVLLVYGVAALASPLQPRGEKRRRSGVEGVEGSSTGATATTRPEERQRRGRLYPKSGAYRSTGDEGVRLGMLNAVK